MVRIFLDDIDGSEAAVTRRFAVDGVSYEIELSELNDKKFKEALAVFVEHARPTGETDPPPEPIPTVAYATSAPPRAVAKAVRQARKTAAKKTAKRATRKAPAAKRAVPAPFAPGSGAPGGLAFDEPGGLAEDVETIDGLDLDPEPGAARVPVFTPEAEEAADDGADPSQPVQVTLQNDELSKAQRHEVRRWMARHPDPVIRAKANARGRLAQSIIDQYFEANPITVRLDFDTD
jgi:hypothetical protein